MYPVLFRIGSFEISSFGLMMFLAFVASGALLSRRFRELGLKDGDASAIVFASAIGGIVGAKIYYAILFHDVRLLFDRAGLVWYGGLLGGFAAVLLVLRRRRLPLLTVADAAAPPLALGYALGRIGCFLVGDDYGRPTTGWYGVAFPHGAPPTTAGSLRAFGVRIASTLPDSTLLRVHPTELYEAVAALFILGLLLSVQRKLRDGSLFAMFLILAGLERFLVEFVRAKDDRFFGPFTLAQAISVGLIIAGARLAAALRRRARPGEVFV
jgi:phosphatidylglycerol:prolipoprotein diacylglycerol transferase